MRRRSFVKKAVISGVGIIGNSKLLPVNALKKFNYTKFMPLLGNRFVTLCIMIRTTPWGDEDIRWFMNKSFRLALVRNWQQNTPEKVIDFTRYDLPAREPGDPNPENPIKDWSLMNRIYQKGLRPQGKPILLKELKKDEKNLIAKYYPELF